MLYPVCDIFKEGVFHGMAAGENGTYQDGNVILKFYAAPETEEEVNNVLSTSNATVINGDYITLAPFSS